VTVLVALLEEASLVVDVVVLAAVAVASVDRVVVLAVLEAWALTVLVVPLERPRPS
jgi:hypothetical protein